MRGRSVGLFDRKVFSLRDDSALLGVNGGKDDGRTGNWSSQTKLQTTIPIQRDERVPGGSGPRNKCQTSVVTTGHSRWHHRRLGHVLLERGDRKELGHTLAKWGDHKRLGRTPGRWGGHNRTDRILALPSEQRKSAWTRFTRRGALAFTFTAGCNYWRGGFFPEDFGWLTTAMTWMR